MLKVKKVDATSSYLQSACSTNDLFFGENRPILVSVRADKRYILLKLKRYSFFKHGFVVLPYHSIIGSKFFFFDCNVSISDLTDIFINELFKKKSVSFILFKQF